MLQRRRKARLAAQEKPLTSTQPADGGPRCSAAGSRSAPTVSPQAHITRTHNQVPLTGNDALVTRCLNDAGVQEIVFTGLPRGISEEIAAQQLAARLDI